MPCHSCHQPLHHLWPSLFKFSIFLHEVLTAHPVFAGKDASRALGMTSTKAEDVSPEWKDLPEDKKGVLNDWVKFFSNRYNIVGVVEGATNFDDEEAPAATASSS